MTRKIYNIFLHNRDLRFIDNPPMNFTKTVIPIFIFEPKQIEPKKNKYFSNNFVQFMVESLREYKSDIKKQGGELYVFYGDTIEILEKINKIIPVASITINIDYSPFARTREKEIKKFCDNERIPFMAFEDHLLWNIHNGQTLNPRNNSPYLIFTPFYNHLLSLDEPNEPTTKKPKFIKLPNDISHLLFDEDEWSKLYVENPNIASNGGRENALNIIKRDFKKKFSEYENKRDELNYETTHLSAYINLNVLSIREIYWAIIKNFGKKSGILRELIFREFYYNLLYFFPHTLKNSYYPKYDKIKWKNNLFLFKKWSSGKTGFPLIDACMRQLNITGYMHNRGRMLVASFLIKNCLIDWRIGEKYFARNLVDYNISSNLGGWSNITGNSPSSQPYFRVFNPSLQNKLYDPQCLYIKKWVAELRDVPPKDIIKWEETFEKYLKMGVSYYAPCLSFNESKKKYLLEMKKIN